MSRRLGIGVVFLIGTLLGGQVPARADAGDERRALGLHYYRGIVLFEAGRYDGALGEFRAVAEIDPHYKFVQRYLDKTMNILKVHRADVLGVDEATIEAGDMDLYFTGKSFFEKGDYRKAAEAFKAVLVKNPADRFAQYYLRLCEEALGEKVETVIETAGEPYTVDEAAVLERSVAYMKDDIEEQKEKMGFYEKQAARRLRRDEVIRAKEKQLERQEKILKEEREDYLIDLRLAQRAKHVSNRTEKWRTMRERLESTAPGTAADLTEYPIMANRGEQYYAQMRESLRSSRWHSAALNALSAAFTYCDAILIYYYGIKSAYPSHKNIMPLLRDNLRRSDAAEHIEHLRAMVGVWELVQDDARSYTRSEAVFLSGKAEKIVEWCRMLMP